MHPSRLLWLAALEFEDPMLLPVWVPLDCEPMVLVPVLLPEP
jgi:hypothetical protein